MSKIWMLLALVLFISPAQAQFSASKKAQSIATLKAVVNYKINDENIEKDVEKLRENKNFNERLQKKLNKLDNKRTQDSVNRNVMKVLEKAGEEIDKLLD